jgi:hypothetical protein
MAIAQSIHLIKRRLQVNLTFNFDFFLIVINQLIIVYSCFSCAHLKEKKNDFDYMYLWWQWKKLKVRLDMLSAQLNKEDLWDDPILAGKINREHGSLLGKMKEVNGLEEELLEHIEMIKLAREENDAELELVGTQFIT